MAYPYTTNNTGSGGADFQVIPRGPLTEECSELSCRGLYLHHMYNGGSPTQSVVVDGNASTGLGTTTVNDWPIHGGLGPYAAVVARARGLHVYAGDWHNSFTIVFEAERFKGSTIQVMGLSVEEGEWAIVGGTGQLAMTRGVIYKRVHERTSAGNIIEITIHGFIPVPKFSQALGPQQPMGPEYSMGPMGSPQQMRPQYPMGPMGPSQQMGPQYHMGPMGPSQQMGPQYPVGPMCSPVGQMGSQYPMGQMSSYQQPLPYNSHPTKVGPWGGSGGTNFDITEAPRRLETVTISSGWVVDSIEFSYFDQSGQRRTAGPWGGSGGGGDVIQLGPSEYVKEFRGTTGYHENHAVVQSLTLVTNMRTYGPFGRNQGDPFSAPMPSNATVVGFFGRAGACVDAIGVYTL